MGATAGTLLVVGLDMTILNVALPDIAIDLSASTAQLQWFADAYLLVLGALLMPAGMLGDRFGRKRFTLAGLMIFAAGSLWCAFAATPGALIGARAVLGVGAAVLIPLAMSAVVVLFEPDERPRAIVLLGAASMLGLPLGPVIAGVLLQHFWWGSVFLVTLPVIVLAFVAVAIFLPETRSSARRRRFDLPGVLLSATGLLCLTYALIEAPELGSSAPAVWGTATVAAGLLIAFFRWERRAGDREPVFDHLLWAVPEFRWGSVVAAVASLGFFGVMFVVPLYLRAVLGVDALGTGLRMLPMVAGLIVGLRITMTLIPRVGAKVAGAGGFLVAVAGLTLGATTTVHSPYLLAATWTALAGAGVGGGLFAGQNAALGALPKARAATGSALIQTLRQVGSVTGIAGLGALLAAVYAGQLQATDLPVPLADAVTDNVVSGVAVAQRLGSAALELQVRSAFVAAMDAALWASAAVAVVGALLVLWRLPAGRVVSDHAVDTVGDPESDRALSDVDNLRT
jgi:EmrB/QacA subfamily drug resistance transporter